MLTRTDHLRRVIDLPVDLSQLTVDERAGVDRFLAWAMNVRAHHSYVASHRRAWWSVGCRQPAAILCTYTARIPSHFVRNLDHGATHQSHCNILPTLRAPRQSLLESVFAGHLRISCQAN